MIYNVCISHDVRRRIIPIFYTVFSKIKLLTEAYSEPCQKSKMEPFAKSITKSRYLFSHKSQLRCLAGF